LSGLLQAGHLPGQVLPVQGFGDLD
jgi:hypothetical protein